MLSFNLCENVEMDVCDLEIDLSGNFQETHCLVRIIESEALCDRLFGLAATRDLVTDCLYVFGAIVTCLVSSKKS